MSSSPAPSPSSKSALYREAKSLGYSGPWIGATSAQLRDFISAATAPAPPVNKSTLYREAKSLGFQGKWIGATSAQLRDFISASTAPVSVPSFTPYRLQGTGFRALPVVDKRYFVTQEFEVGQQATYQDFCRIVDEQHALFVRREKTVGAAIRLILYDQDGDLAFREISAANYSLLRHNADRAIKALLLNESELAGRFRGGSDVEKQGLELSLEGFTLLGYRPRIINGDSTFDHAITRIADSEQKTNCFARSLMCSDVSRLSCKALGLSRLDEFERFAFENELTIDIFEDEPNIVYVETNPCNIDSGVRKRTRAVSLANPLFGGALRVDKSHPHYDLYLEETSRTVFNSRTVIDEEDQEPDSDLRRDVYEYVDEEYVDNEAVGKQKFGPDNTPLYRVKLSQACPLKLFRSFDYARPNTPSYVQLVISRDHSHVELLETHRELLVDGKGRFYDAETLSLIKQRRVRAKKPVSNVSSENELWLCTYDIESVYDGRCGSMLRPYSISWSLRRASDSKGKVWFYMGRDSINVFIKFLRDNSDKRMSLIGYNSSRFDNFFLAKGLLEHEMIKRIKFVGSSILNLEFGASCFSFDLCRILATSLARACKEMRPAYQKQPELVSHSEVQSYFNLHGEVNSLLGIAEGYYLEREFEVFRNQSGELVGKELDVSEKIVQYNMLDVLATDSLYEQVNKVLKDNGLLTFTRYETDKQGRERIVTKTKELCEKSTIGQLAFSLLSSNLDKHRHMKKRKQAGGFELPKLDMEQYAQIRSSLTAGRTQCHNLDTPDGSYVDLTGDKQYRFLDVKSLYPGIYLNRQFPCGKIVNGPYSDCKLRGLIGFYSVTFTQPESMKVKVLPRREEGESLDWRYSGRITRVLNTIDIEQLQRHGATIHCIGKGFYFSELIDGKTLFAPMQQARILKEREDAKPASERNPVLRGLAKLLLNSLSGKVIQRVFQKEQVLVRGAKEFYETLEKRNGDVDIVYGLGDMHVMTYEKPYEKCFFTQRKPIWLGCLIYSYARAYMMDTMLSKYKAYYQDTDSALLEASEAARFERENPELMGGNFLQYEDEDTGGETISKILILAPKLYFLFSKDNRLLKKGAKGISLERDIYLSDETLAAHKNLFKVNFDCGTDSKGVKRVVREVSIQPSASVAEIHEFYFAEGNRKLHLTSPESILSFYQCMQTEGAAPILSCSLRKDMSTLGLSNQYTVKNIHA